MNLFILAMLVLGADAAPTSDAAADGGQGHACALVVEASPLVRGTHQSRIVHLGIVDDDGPTRMSVHLVREKVERAPVWGDVVSISFEDLESASRTVAQDDEVTGELVPPSTHCQSTDGPQMPFAKLEVLAPVSGVSQ